MNYKKETALFSLIQHCMEHKSDTFFDMPERGHPMEHLTPEQMDELEQLERKQTGRKAYGHMPHEL